ncbi:MAG: DUF4286 family protein [Legionellales bacterium]|nr:DUF4286 family protein [Legionellales bacterium]
MVIYEVNLAINDEIYTEFRLWLKEHVNEMLQFQGFIKASILRPELDEASAQEKLTIQYQLENRDNLERYFTEFAAKMREEGIKRFNDKFSATRRVFEVEEIIMPIRLTPKTTICSVYRPHAYPVDTQDHYM